MNGAQGTVRLASGKRMKAKGQQSIPRNDRLVLEMAGGGGFGDPRQRDPQRVAEDVRNGFVSRERAEAEYAVALDALGRVDAEDVEPVDIEQARAEEDEFWAQTWDEPDEDW